METKTKNKGKMILAGVLVLIVLAGLAALSFGSYCKGMERNAEEIVKLNEKHTKELAEKNEEIEELENKLKEMIDTPVFVVPVRPEIDMVVINKELKEIGELATMEYLYTDSARFTDSMQLFDRFNIPITKKSFVMKWDGIIKAGIQIKNLSATVDEEKMEIMVFLPKAEILSHEVDDKSTETLDESSNIFNPIKVNDVNNFISANKDEMRIRAIENGLLEKAEENAQRIITSLLNADEVIRENYSIVFKEAADENT